MNRISVVMNMYTKDKFNWFIIPGAILTAIFFINWFISYHMEQPMYTGGFSYYFIFFMATGITSFLHNFPFALSFSVRRLDYLLGTLAMSVCVSAASAIIFTLLSFTEKTLNGWGTELHFFNLPYLSDGSYVQQFWIFFATLLHLFYLGSMIATIYLRFHSKGVYTFIISLLLLGTVFSYFATRFGWWEDIFNWMKDHTAFGLASWLGLVAVLYVFVIYVLLRRATIQ